MRTRILFHALVCLLLGPGILHAAGSPENGMSVPCHATAVAPDPGRDIIPIRYSPAVPPDRGREVVPVPPSGVAQDRPCAVAGDRCALSGQDWTIYPDSSPGAPDFWRLTSVEVPEIVVCEHGLQFLFPADQDGKARLAALVFPVPTAELLLARTEVAPGAELEADLAHFRNRYAALLRSLDELSGGWGGPMHRALPAGADRPRIRPQPLDLTWGGETRRLRGYLDVYFTDPDEPVVVASADGSGTGGDPGTRASVAAARPVALAVAPNPGGAAGYEVSLSVPVAGSVRLRMFDVAGRRIATLIDGSRPAGPLRVRWDGRSANGDRVGAGVYFARLETAAGDRTVKLVHLAR